MLLYSKSMTLFQPNNSFHRETHLDNEKWPQSSDYDHFLLRLVTTSFRSRVNSLLCDYVQAVSCEETPEMISGHHVNTHVFVSDSRRGYGVSIQDMLEAAGIAEEQAA